MSVKQKENTNSGIGVLGVLQLIFLVLKLCGLINWSWLWVLAPTWIGCGLIIIALLIVLVAALVSDRGK